MKARVEMTIYCRRLLIWLLVGVFGSPAFALVGPASEDFSYSGHVVMVLKRAVDRAGFCTGVVVAPRAILTAAHCVSAIGDMRVHYRDDAGRPVLIEVEAVAAVKLNKT